MAATRSIRKVVRRGAAFGLTAPWPTTLEPRSGGVSLRVLAKRRWVLGRNRTYGSGDLDSLAEMLDRANAVLSIREAFARRDDRPERLVALRHDTDGDIENSVRFAEWEAAHGFVATYYALHTDWYYRDLRSNRPSRFVLAALDQIASLGHEIGLHNNAIAVSLKTGEDPDIILDRELTALRGHGFDIVGTAAHGDPICDEANFVNFEMFSECPYPRYGAPDRTISWQDVATGRTRTTSLRPRPMADFGLTHEAYFIGQTLYLSDVGGRWSPQFATIDRQFEREGGFLQVLIHPEWWAHRRLEDPELRQGSVWLLEDER